MNWSLIKYIHLLFSRKIIPDAEFADITKIDSPQIKKLGAEAIIFDLDGVLAIEDYFYITRSDIRETFEKLNSDFNSCILSNNQKLADDDALRKKAEENAGIKLISAKTKKPSPDAYKEAIEYLSLPPGKIVMITDKLYDIAGGKNVGLKMILTKSIDLSAEPVSSRIERVFEESIFGLVKILNK